MKKLLLILIITLLMACGSSKLTDGSGSLYHSNMSNQNISLYNTRQVDSMIYVDNLPSLDLWSELDGKDYESKEVIQIFFFIKNDSIEETLYKLEKPLYDDIYKLTKRISYKDNEQK